jgi:hypothetical protein
VDYSPSDQVLGRADLRNCHALGIRKKMASIKDINVYQRLIQRD